MPLEMLTYISLNMISNFLSMHGIETAPDSLEIKEFGPHVVYIFQSQLSSAVANCGDPAAMLWSSLEQYLAAHNSIPTVIQFLPYQVEVYNNCPCGAVAYIGIYYTA